MRMKSLITIMLTACLLVLTEECFAQRKAPARNKYQVRKATNRDISHYKGGRVPNSRFRKYWYVGGSVNAMNYFGDLAPINKAASTDVSFTRPGLGVQAGYKFHHSMALRASLNYGRLKGDDITADPGAEADAPRYARNLSFRNDIKELSLGAEIYLFPNYAGPAGRPPLNGYLFLGVAVFHHEPKGKVPDFDYQTDINGGVAAPQAGEWVKLRPLGTEGQNFGMGVKYSPIQFAIPVALGAEFYVNPQLSVGIEFGARFLFFDHLDDVSGDYVNLDRFDDPLGRIMSDRSTEPKGVWKGENRNLPYPVTPTDYGSVIYNTVGNLGSGLDHDNGGGNRGNPGNNDMYFMTQIRATYILRNKGYKAKSR
jgi:hypothetical protein